MCEKWIEGLRMWEGPQSIGPVLERTLLDSLFYWPGSFMLLSNIWYAISLSSDHIWCIMALKVLGSWQRWSDLLKVKFPFVSIMIFFFRPDLNSLGVRDRDGRTPLNLALCRWWGPNLQQIRQLTNLHKGGNQDNGINKLRGSTHQNWWTSNQYICNSSLQ